MASMLAVILFGIIFVMALYQRYGCLTLIMFVLFIIIYFLLN